MKFSVLIFLYSSWFLMICLYYDYFIMALPGILILGKLSPQTSRYWVPINIWNQVSHLNSPNTNTAGETIYIIPTLAFPDVYLLNTFLLSTFSAVFSLSFSARLPQLQAALTYISLGQFILWGIRLFYFQGCVQFFFHYY